MRYRAKEALTKTERCGLNYCGGAEGEGGRVLIVPAYRALTPRAWERQVGNFPKKHHVRQGTHE